MKTVLVVDDDALVRSMMDHVLQQHGFTVITAGSSMQAIELFRSHAEEIDLVISDVSMPEMDGVALVTELSVLRPGLPVLLMSGCCDPEKLCDRFELINKPFTIEDLMARIRNLNKTRGAC